MWEFDGKVYGYTIEVSSNNVHWSTVVNKKNNTNTSQTQQDFFKCICTICSDDGYKLSSGCWASFWEFKVFVSSTNDVDQAEAITERV